MPAEGWYEWEAVQQVDTKTGEIKTVKQPHFIHRPDEPIFAFAGLMSRLTGPTGEEVYSCAVLTKSAAPAISEVHIRMPVVLVPAQYEQWVDPTQGDPTAVATLILNAQTEFVHHKVRTWVNSTRNESPELVEPVTEGAEGKSVTRGK